MGSLKENKMKDTYLIPLFFERFKVFEDTQNFDESFSEVDAKLFFEQFEKAEIKVFTTEEKQSEWTAMRKDLSWYTPTKNNPTPTKMQATDKCKANLFKSWFLDCYMSGIDFREVVQI